MGKNLISKSMSTALCPLLELIDGEKFDHREKWAINANVKFFTYKCAQQNVKSFVKANFLAWVL